MKNVSRMATIAAAAAFAAGSGWAEARDIQSSAPPNFKRVSTLIKLPDYLPGMGTLYVDPSTLPVGPFLGYDRGGKLVNVIYMVPIKEFEQQKAFNKLGAGVPGLKVDHTDLSFNPGHPGMAEPHYHITQWLISHAEEEKRMK